MSALRKPAYTQGEFHARLGMVVDAQDRVIASCLPLSGESALSAKEVNANAAFLSMTPKLLRALEHSLSLIESFVNAAKEGVVCEVPLGTFMAIRDMEAIAKDAREAL